MNDLIYRQEAIAALERDILDPPVMHDAIASIRELPAVDCISRQAAIDMLLDNGMITAAIYIERL